MQFLIAQYVLAARNEDFEGWMQLLVFIILAVFYALANLLKAKKTKTEPEEEPELPGRKGPAKPPEAVRRVHLRGVEWPERAVKPQIQRPRPVVTTPEIELEKIGIEPQEIVSERVKGLEEEKLGIGLEEAQPEEEIEKTLFDFEEPDELKKAIVHYEILGKPVSLRDKRM